METLNNFIDKIPQDFKKNNSEIIEIFNKYALFVDNNIKINEDEKITLGKENLMYINETLKKIINNMIKHYNDSFKDFKTNAYNMKFFYEFTTLEFLESLRDNRDFSIALIDIDSFKDLNDSNGHLLGDKILLEVSKVLKETIRTSDVLARFGGDEFILFLSDYVNGLDNFIIKLNENSNKNKILSKYKVNFSVGISSKKEDDSSIKDIILRADKALYQAKSKLSEKYVIL